MGEVSEVEKTTVCRANKEFGLGTADKRLSNQSHRTTLHYRTGREGRSFEPGTHVFIRVFMPLVAATAAREEDQATEGPGREP